MHLETAQPSHYSRYLNKASLLLSNSTAQFNLVSSTKLSSKTSSSVPKSSLNDYTEQTTLVTGSENPIGIQLSTQVANCQLQNEIQSRKCSAEASLTAAFLSACRLEEFWKNCQVLGILRSLINIYIAIVTVLYQFLFLLHLRSFSRRHTHSCPTCFGCHFQQITIQIDLKLWCLAG